MMDPRLAETLLAERGDQTDTEPEAPPTPEGWGIDTYLLANIIDGLIGVQMAVIAAAGAEPPSMRPMPRPVTALDQARDAHRLASMQTLIDQFSPRPDAG